MDTPDLQSPSKSKKRRQRTKRQRQRAGSTSPAEEETPATAQRRLELELEATLESPEEQKAEENKDSDSPSLSTQRNDNATMVRGHSTQIGGVSIKLNEAAATDTAGSLTALKKEDRKGLDADKKHALFQMVTKKQHDQFELQVLTNTSVKDLQDTYNLQVMLETVRTHFRRYDVLDVFNIVFPKKNLDGQATHELEMDPTTNEAKTVNLLDHYSELTLEQVMESSCWYSRWPDTAENPWFRENLTLSYDYFSNHMTPALWGKVLEDIKNYNGTQALGGPLVFHCMMARLQVSSQLAVETIQAQFKTLRIDQYQGENVDELVSHLRSMIIRLKSLERRVNGVVVQSNLPHNISKLLITMFQTSSDPTFNEVFHQRQVAAYEHFLKEGDRAFGDPETLMNLAVMLYHNQVASEEGWHGQYHKANETGFVAVKDNKPTRRCFNCDKEGCSVKICKSPKDPERIKRNKKAFLESKPSKGEKSKWVDQAQFRHLAHPTSKKKNRVKVNKKWYWFHFKSKTWRVCDQQTEQQNRPYAMLSGSSTSNSSSTTSTTPASSTTTSVPSVAQPAPAPTDHSVVSGMTAATNPQLRQQLAQVATQMNALITAVNQQE